MEDAQQYYWNLPPLTRIWATASFLLTGAATVELLDPEMLLYDWDRIWNHLELWRIATAFLYGGGPMRQFHVILLLYLIVTMSQQYERQPLNTGAGGTRPDAAFAMIFCAIVILTTAPLLDSAGPKLLEWWYSYGELDPKGQRLFHHYHHRFQMEPVYTRTLIYAILYLWSRRHPEARANINFVPMPAKFIPLAHIALGVMMGHRVHETIHGIVVGHLFYYVTIVMPALTQGRLGFISTPQVLIDWCSEPINNAALDRVDRAAGVYERDNDDDDDDDVAAREPPATGAVDEDQDLGDREDNEVLPPGHHDRDDEHHHNN